MTSGGLLPALPVLVPMLGVGTTLAAAFLRRPASTRRLVTLVAGGPTLVHDALSVTAGHGHDGHVTPSTAPAPAPLPPGPLGSAPLPTDAGGRVGSLQDHYEAIAGAPVATGLAMPDPTALVDHHLPMFLSHTAAGVLVGLWLAMGERAVWALLALAVALAVRTVLAPRCRPRGRSRPPARRPRPAAAGARPAPRAACPRRAHRRTTRSAGSPRRLTYPSRLPAHVRPRRSSGRTSRRGEHDHRTHPVLPARPPSGAGSTAGSGWFRAFWRWHFYAASWSSRSCSCWP